MGGGGVYSAGLEINTGRTGATHCLVKYVVVQTRPDLRWSNILTFKLNPSKFFVKAQTDWTT